MHIDTHGGTTGNRFIPPEEHKAAEGSNCGLLLRGVTKTTKPDSSLKKCTSQDKRLQSQVGAREIPVGHVKKFTTARIK